MKTTGWLLTALAASALTLTLTRRPATPARGIPTTVDVPAAQAERQLQPGLDPAPPAAVDDAQADAAKYAADLADAEAARVRMLQTAADIRVAAQQRRAQRRAARAAEAASTQNIIPAAESELPASAPVSSKFVRGEQVSPVDADHPELGYVHTTLYSDGSQDVVTNDSPSARLGL